MWSLTGWKASWWLRGHCLRQLPRTQSIFLVSCLTLRPLSEILRPREVAKAKALGSAWASQGTSSLRPAHICVIEKRLWRAVLVVTWLNQNQGRLVRNTSSEPRVRTGPRNPCFSLNPVKVCTRSTRKCPNSTHQQSGLS